MSFDEKRAYLYGQRIGLMIGSFNPPHLGHLNMAENVRKGANLDRIWWLPSPQSPHKKAYSLSTDKRRQLIIDLIESDSRSKSHHVIRLEDAISTNKTYNLLKYLVKYDKRKFYLIIGQDNYLEIDTWFKWEYIINLVDVLVYRRPLHKKTTNKNSANTYSLAWKNSKATHRWQRYSNQTKNNNSVHTWRVVIGPLSQLSSSNL